MRKSVSTPSFQGQCKGILKRNVSSHANLADVFREIGKDVVLEFQIESATHTSSLSGLCASNKVFPMDLLDKNKIFDDDAKNVVSCMASPPDGDVSNSGNQEDISKRTLNMLLRVRSARRRKVF